MATYTPLWLIDIIMEYRVSAMREAAGTAMGYRVQSLHACSRASDKDQHAQCQDSE